MAEKREYDLRMFRKIAKVLLRAWLTKILNGFTTDIGWLEIQQIRHLVKDIDGCPDSHGMLLYGLAKSGPGKGAIVEIGSWKGKSTIWLAKGSKSTNREKVFAIDPHTGSVEHRKALGDHVNTGREFRRNIKRAEVEDWVVPLVMRSTEAAVNWREPVRLLWIDGSHEYEDVKSDFVLWERHLVDDGIIALHDSFGFAGPRRVIKELLLTSDAFSNIGFVGGLVFAKKTKKLTGTDRLSNFAASIGILTVDFVVEHTPSKITGIVSQSMFY